MRYVDARSLCLTLLLNQFRDPESAASGSWPSAPAEQPEFWSAPAQLVHCPAVPPSAPPETTTRAQDVVPSLWAAEARVRLGTEQHDVWAEV